ncbi:MAG TPA: aspartate/glutamate racemase family protein [Casimicrobiaceae bacterium]|nr:aspartate/glutamate racemase family protein [Casimicrobiaceae bacterium]
MHRNPRLDGVRVGLIVPSVNATIEPELAWIAPASVSFHCARVMLRETTAEGLREMNAEVESAARLLASLAPNAVAYACTSGSFLEGAERLRAQIDAISRIVRCPVVATSQAMIDALRALRVRRMALATPYLDALTQIERRFLEDQGFDIVSLRSLGLSGAAIREVSPERVFELACEADSPHAEAIFVSCTDLRALEIVDALERHLSKPVLTSNQVTLWALLRALGRSAPIAGFGRLLDGAAATAVA